MASVTSEMSDRIPLHASATSRLVFASTMTLPSRRTGIAMADNVSSAPFDARSCSGNVIALITMAGGGTMSSR